jgi:hypothetical protein
MRTPVSEMQWLAKLLMCIKLSREQSEVIQTRLNPNVLEIGKVETKIVHSTYERLKLGGG